MLLVKDLCKVYSSVSTGKHLAVNHLSFEVKKGEILSVIGESGSGKTTLGNLVLKLTKPTSGSISYMGKDVTGIRGRRNLKSYYREVQAVFQDPFSTFNPIFRADRVFDIIRREFFPGIKAGEWTDRVNLTLQRVGLNPADVRNKFPHQLSGGQLQRLLIARALLLEAKLIIADEIISMLDASTRIDVLNLLGLMRESGLSMIFITHDLSLGYYISDRVVILYKGVMVEAGKTEAVFNNPQHPYSRSLLNSVPRLDRKWNDVPEEGELILGDRLFDPDLHHDLPGLERIADDHFVAVKG